MSQEAIGQLIISAAPTAVQQQSGVSLFSQVGTQDVVLIATTQHEMRCKREITAWQEKVRRQREVIARMIAALTEKATNAIELQLRSPLDTSKSFYAAWGMPFEYSVDVSEIAGSRLRASIKMYASKRKSSSYSDSYHHENENNATREFTYEELSLGSEKQQLVEAEAAARELESALGNWRQALSELPTFERQARAALAAHALQQDANGNKLVASLMDAAGLQVQDLPSAVANIDVVGAMPDAPAEEAPPAPPKPARAASKKPAKKRK